MSKTFFIDMKRHTGISLFVAFLLGLTNFTGIASLQARPLDEVMETKYLRVFVYENHPPYSYIGADKKITGIDVEIGRRLAQELGVSVRFFVRIADESVDDDLRNNIWKGHYLGGGIADVMMHVPVDDVLRQRNDLTVIFGRYYTERISLLSDVKKVGRSGTLAPFLNEKLGAELDTLADFYLSSPGTLSGRLREQVVRYRDFSAAMVGLKNGEVAGLMGPRGQLEAAQHGAGNIEFSVSTPPFPGMIISRWDIGMAVKHNSRDLGHKLGDIILGLRKKGELKAIFKKYGLSYYKDFLD